MAEAQTEFSVLVTGANGGLGTSICQRLIDEFLYLRPQSENLLLIPTARSKAKCEATVKKLKAHVETAVKTLSKNLPGSEALLRKRVRFRAETVDLCALHTVRDLARRLSSSSSSDGGGLAKLDVAIFNAGMGGWIGIDLPRAVYKILTDFPYSVTFPSFKVGEAGLQLQRQLPLGKDCQPQDEPRTGEVFTANVLGHYMLCRWLAPLMGRSSYGRAIWLSSLEAYEHMFSTADFQAMRSSESYESTKRLTDVLIVTSRLPSTAPWTKTFFSGPQQLQTEAESKQQPQMYVCHPGVCATGIMPLNMVFVMLMYAAFYVARWCGSIWHPVDPYKGACAPVWLALASAETLSGLEQREGVSKWGSATDREGGERVERTEVEGWGYGGVVGDASSRVRKGRVRGVRDLSQEDRERFEELGRACWQEMERVRGEWEGLLDEHGL